MRIGKRATLPEIDAEAWAVFARDAGIGLPFIRRRVPDLCERIVARASDAADAIAMPGLNEAAIEDFAVSIKNRAEICALTVSK